MGIQNVSASTHVYEDGIAEVRVRGGIASNLGATEIVNVMSTLIDGRGAPKIIICIKELSYIDSFSFNWILNIYRQCVQQGGILAISDPNEDIRELFEITNIGKAIPIYLTGEDAREALRSGDDSKRILK